MLILQISFMQDQSDTLIYFDYDRTKIIQTDLAIYRLLEQLNVCTSFIEPIKLD